MATRDASAATITTEVPLDAVGESSLGCEPVVGVTLGRGSLHDDNPENLGDNLKFNSNTGRDVFVPVDDILIDDEVENGGERHYYSIMEELFGENPEDVDSWVYGPCHGYDHHVPQSATVQCANVTVSEKGKGPEDIAADLLVKHSISADDIEILLNMVHFGSNTTRKNVIPGNLQSVHSETAGAIRTRRQRLAVSLWTHRYPTVVNVVIKWARHQGCIGDDFRFPSITVNKIIHQNCTGMPTTMGCP